MDPWLHYYRTLKLFNDEELAWEVMAVDFPPAKEIIHLWLWEDKELQKLDSKVYLAVYIHVTQDILWSLIVRKYIASENNLWIHRVAEILWTRENYPKISEPNIEVIEEFLSYFGGFSSKTEESLRLLWKLYNSSEEELAKFAGISKEKLRELVNIISQRIDEYYKIEKKVFTFLRDIIEKLNEMYFYLDREYKKLSEVFEKVKYTGNKKEIWDLVVSYWKDCKYFYEKKDYVKVFELENYIWGMLDILANLGFLDVPKEIRGWFKAEFKDQ